MDLSFDPSLASSYKSRSQIARVLTEAWAEGNLYCAACPSDRLDPAPNNKKVVDFTCPECAEEYQLKGQAKPFGYRVSNSAYEPKIKRIRAGTNPSYLFLQYDPRRYHVSDLFLVPAHFMTPSIIERRKELSASARRSGWVGSNILIGMLPQDARISLVERGEAVPRREVRKGWERFTFLKDARLDTRGWLTDVLACVRELDREFTLADVYACEERLARLHPKNRHIRPKIRQQLQVLRDREIIEFTGRGRYLIKAKSF